jgi:hypothetical protein
MEEVAFKPLDLSKGEYPATEKLDLMKLLITYGQKQILSGTKLGGGANKFFTVPEGYTFFLTGSNISIYNTNTAVGENANGIIAVNVNSNIAIVYLTPLISTNSLSVDHSFPLKLTSGESVSAYLNSTNCSVAVCIQGYLISNEILKTFF